MDSNAVRLCGQNPVLLSSPIERLREIVHRVADVRLNLETLRDLWRMSARFKRRVWFLESQ